MDEKLVFRALILFFLAGCATVRPTPLADLNSLSAGAIARLLFPSAGGKAEGFLVRPRGTGPLPLLSLLHGHTLTGAGGTRVLPAANVFANEVCYAGLAVSLPEYGDTETATTPPAQATRQVVLDALATARQISWIDGERIYIYGHSRGAVVAAALIKELDGLKGALLHSGAYDLQRLHDDSSSFLLRKLLNPNGDADPKLPNILPKVTDWQAPTLILHGQRDTLIPVSQAMLLRQRLASLGKPHRLVIFPEHGHRLPSRDIKDQAVAFLKENGGSACPSQ